MRAALISIAALSLAACSGGANDNTSQSGAKQPLAAGSYYETQIAPILEANCATCHQTGLESGNISLLPRNAVGMLVDVDSIEATGVKRVVPGKPDESYLIMKLEGSHVQHGGSGSQMPFGAPPLPADQIAKFRKWIEEGAKP